MESLLKNIRSEFFNALLVVCGSNHVQRASEENALYGKDEATRRVYSFDYLAKPANEQEIADIIKLCNTYHIPITPRGGGSGVSGGASPVNGGLILSLERLNRIIAINTLDKTVIAESGVITDVLCRAVEEQGLYFPVKPGSSAMSVIGGNVAENSAGMNSLKYGTTKDYVLNLQVVLPNGEIIWTGANTSKNSTGLNVTQLFTGSEGILGIVTKVVLRLIPKPALEFCLLAEFDTTENLCRAVSAITLSRLRPCALEIVDEFSVKLTAAFLADKVPALQTHRKAQLLLSFDGDREAQLNEELEICYELIQETLSGEVLIAKTNIEKEKLWQIRLNIGNALTQNDRAYRDIDIAVPVSRLSEFISSVYAIAALDNIRIACFGHAGNGNLHTMVSVTDHSELESERVKTAIDQIYRSGIDLGGTISGEHGIGILQKKYMPLQHSKAYLDLTRAIKAAFDPGNILNPGKII